MFGPSDPFDDIALELGMNAQDLESDNHYSPGDHRPPLFLDDGTSSPSPRPQGPNSHFSSNRQNFQQTATTNAGARDSSTPRTEYNDWDEAPTGRHQVTESLRQTHDHHSRSAIAPRASNPRTASGIALRPVSDLPDVYQYLFKFGVFNAIQTQCFDTAVNSDQNMVISAPTGSGKTVLFELAIIRMLSSGKPNTKCVYMAPTKALCTERFNDWTQKFQHIGVTCCEMTGDTVPSGRHAWTEAQNSTIIVTTPEKWDSLTRNWGDHNQILSCMQLFLVDEVHILNETRGSTVEVCLSRMKTRGTSVRFILLSATAPNIEDIAMWVGDRLQRSSAKVFRFGDEYRPCKISRHVYGYPQKQQNDHQFSRTLDFKVFELIERHGEGKPTLVFCPTRKTVASTAEQLAKQFRKLVDEKRRLPWPLPKRRETSFQDKQLSALYAAGLGIHHAGLPLEDRRLTEALFIKGDIQVVIATSTLAVGVNLRRVFIATCFFLRHIELLFPQAAHTVVIKGTRMWGGADWVEYPDLDIIQMMGRAGRPQFDTQGTAIIMCSSDKEARYKAITSGQTIIESCLHLNLTEHLNSEIGLGTITDLASAKSWLHNSFLFQRISKNPLHYALGKATNQTWRERLDELVNDSINSLSNLELVETKSSGAANMIAATEYGEIMSKYYIRYRTMSLILSLPEKATMKEILEVITQADEFGDMRLRGSDKAVYNKLREHNDIRFRVGKIEKTADKVMVLIQAILGGISLNSPEYKTADSQPGLEAVTIFRHANRIARALVDTAIAKKSGSQVKYGMELVRSLGAKAWEDRPIVLRQIARIGEKSIKVLASAGVTTISLLQEQNPARIDMLLNRRAPFGHEIVAEAKSFPQYSLALSEECTEHFGGDNPVTVTLTVEASLVTPLKESKGKKSRSSALGYACILALTSDMELIDFRRIPVKMLQEPRSYPIVASLTKPSQSILVSISSENFAGLNVTKTYKPMLPASIYPTRNTRPLTSLEADLEGLEDEADIWTITEEEIQDLTASRTSAPSRADMTLNEGNSKDAISKTTNAKEKNNQTTSHDPARLPSGSYACNHTCKDKMKCRHLCCREGLSKPPPIKKAQHNGGTKATASLSKGDTPGQRKLTGSEWTREENPPKKAKANDSRFDDLEQLNARTKVALTVPSGKRLTVQNSRRPSKLSAKHNMPSFTRLDDAVIKTVDIVEDDDDDDDLPELTSLLKPHVKGKARPTTNDSDVKVIESGGYSDHDLDDYLDNAPSWMFDDIDSPAPSQRTNDEPASSFGVRPNKIHTPAATHRKRPRDTDELIILSPSPPLTSKASKRARTETTSTAVHSCRSTKPSTHDIHSSTDRPRREDRSEQALPSSSKEPATKSFGSYPVRSGQSSPRVSADGQYDFSFVLESDPFEIIEEDTYPEHRTPSSTRAGASNSSTSSLALRDNQSAMKGDVTTEVQDNPRGDNDDDSDCDELKEFMDWVYNSGQVDLVKHV